MTGGEALVAALRALDVEVAFGLPGVHNLAAWRGFPGSGVRLVGVRHEQTAGYAADGWARATGRLGVALTTTGPGASNVVTAVGEAWASHSPLLVVATDVPTTVRRPGQYRGVLHETVDQAGFFRPVTKAQHRVGSAEELFDVVVRAGREAMTHPRRPVYVEVPTDLLQRSRRRPARPGRAAPPAGRWCAPCPDLAAADGRSSGPAAAPRRRAPARRSPGWRSCSALPVLTSYGGRGLLPPDAPALVPLPPHAPEAGALWDAADLVVVLGSDLDAMNTQGFRQPRPPRVVAVDLGDAVNTVPGRARAGRRRRGARRAAAAGGARRRARPGGPGPRVARRTPAPRRRSSTRSSPGCPTTPSSWPTCASRATGTAGSAGSPVRAAWPTRWAGGRSASASRPGSVPPCPAGPPSRSSATAASCSPAATSPPPPRSSCPLTTVLVDDGGYGMLAYDFTKDGLRRRSAATSSRRTSSRWPAAFRVQAREVTVDELGPAVARGRREQAPDPARGRRPRSPRR